MQSESIYDIIKYQNSFNVTFGSMAQTDLQASKHMCTSEGWYSYWWGMFHKRKRWLIVERIIGKQIHAGVLFGEIFVFDSRKGALIAPKNAGTLIVASENLSPNETAQFNKLNLRAFVATSATETSHTAILARTMDLPAITGITVDESWQGKEAIVDGYSGCLIIEPDEQTRRFYEKKTAEEEDKKRQLLDTYKHRKAISKSGTLMNIYANISSPDDVEKVLANGADGIGVFKSEFMYLNASNYPTEEELFSVYRQIASAMEGRKTVIRTFDIGADKTADYFGLGKEENPALGYRAIRIGIDRPSVFKTQLRAIIRASAFGNVSLMYPMVTSADELIKIKQMVCEVMDGLRNERIPFDEYIEQGIMIETPASVIISDILAQMVDFFSIGTNDLIQYTLAADRQNPKLSSIYDPYHPAILRSIEYVAKNAKNSGIWVEISGELGADPTLTEQFMSYGINALAVVPSKVLPIRKMICEME